MQSVGSTIRFMDVTARGKVCSMLVGGGVAHGVRGSHAGRCSALKCRPRFLHPGNIRRNDADPGGLSAVGTGKESHLLELAQYIVLNPVWRLPGAVLLDHQRDRETCWQDEETPRMKV